MANYKGLLYWHCKTELGWRRFPVVEASNGKIKNGVIVDGGGVERKYPEGSFHLRVLDGSRTLWRNVGSVQNDALDAARQEITRRKKNQPLPDDQQGKKKDLMKLRDEFMETVGLKGQRGIISLSRITIDGFLKSSKCQQPEDVNKNHVLRFIKEQREDGYQPWTLFTRSRRLMKFLNIAGCKREQLPATADLPEKPNDIPESYSNEEMAAFFAGIDPNYALIFETFWKTGLRERELTFLEPHNLELDGEVNVLTVQNKPQLGFIVKNKRERAVTIEAGLADKLRDHLAANPGRRFVFGTRNNKPQRHLIRIVKRTARELDLNCGTCETCVSKGECEHWYLHKFRATFATMCLRSNQMDPHTLMHQMGHTKLEMTLRYLARARQQTTQGMMDAVWNTQRSSKVIRMPKSKVALAEAG
jgi:integrase